MINIHFNETKNNLIFYIISVTFHLLTFKLNTFKINASSPQKRGEEN